MKIDAERLVSIGFFCLSLVVLILALYLMLEE